MTLISLVFRQKCRQECFKFGGEICRRCQESQNRKFLSDPVLSRSGKKFGVGKVVVNADGKPYDVIRGMWEGAYVSHFLRLFQSKLGFDSLTTQDLEEALVDDESFELANIFARLMRYATGNTDILITNFDQFLKEILSRGKVVSRLIENQTAWKDLTPEEKLGILKWLVDHVYQEKEEDIVDYLDENYSADELRGICVGQDAFNNSYWYLDDLRLYREFSYKKQSKKDWECVCFTLSDWKAFIKQFRKTSNLQEKELYCYLNFELYPFIEPELIGNIKKILNKKNEKNDFLIDEERRELSVMLEKKPALDSNDSSVKSATLCSDVDYISGVSADPAVKTLNNISEPEDTSSQLSLTDCDGDLKKTDKTSPVGVSLTSSVMDIKTCASGNNCTSSSASSNASSHEVPALIGSGSMHSSEQESISSISASSVSCNVPTREGSQEVVQQPINDITSDNNSVASNKENAPPSSGNLGNDIPPMSAISSMVGPATAPPVTASIQPLPSNVVNKASYQMEAQYMQQQSQIFVFSTTLANKAAESYLSGNFPSIIAYHCAQPGTKSFLEKYPLKVQQFNRQNPSAWLNSLAQAKQLPGGRQLKPAFSSSHTASSRFPGSSSGSIGDNCTNACRVHNPEMCANMHSSWPNNCSTSGIGSSVTNDIASQSWPSQMAMGAASPSGNHRFPNPVHGMNLRPIGPSGNYGGCVANINSNATMFPNSALNSIQMNRGPGCPSLTGVKVPDENLTPQQRQHREEQLATIRKMQQLLFPEQQQINQGGVMPNMMPVGMQNQHDSHSRFPMPNSCVHSGMDECFSPHQQSANENDHSHIPIDMYSEAQMIGANLMQQTYPPGSVSAQLEWQKLQSQFFDERTKKVVSNCPTQTNSFPGVQNQTALQHSTSQPLTPQQSPSPALGLSPGARMQGPPPPYHQANKRAMPSPHPPSPNTSALSLPSPLAVSGLPSPADPSSRQFPVPTPPGPKLSHPSPGSSTTAGNSSLHTTPLNSPKPPGSISNMTHIRTPTTPSNTFSTPCGTPTSSCPPGLSSSPATPTTTCSSNFNQCCAIETEDVNSHKLGSSASSEFSASISIATSRNAQGEVLCHDVKTSTHSSQKPDEGSNSCGVGEKEPNLMPVPSPQQIQYLNAFDGQELTIQKQPNTGVRDIETVSPRSVPPSMPASSASQSHFTSPDSTPFSNNPGSCPSALETNQDNLSAQCSSISANKESSIPTFTALNPQVPAFDSGLQHVQSSQPNDSSAQFSSNQNAEILKNHGSNAMPQNTMLETSGRFHESPHNPAVSSLNNANNPPRFPSNVPDTLDRLHGSRSHVNMDMGQSRFSGVRTHMKCMDNFAPPSQFCLGSEQGSPDQKQAFSVPSMASQQSPCIGNSFLDNNISYSHLQNLEKMTPPFENISGSKLSSDVISSVPQCSNTIVSSSNITACHYGRTSTLSPATVSPSQRLAHFDPIASMAAMSDSTAHTVQNSGNMQTHPNVIPSNMNVANMQNSITTGNGSMNIPSHTDVQPMQNTQNSSCTLSNQNIFSVHNRMDNTNACINPSNSIYTMTTMQPSHVSSQNTATCATYASCNLGSNVHSHSFHPNCLGNGANTLSCSVTTNHPIMHTTVTAQTTSSSFMGLNAKHVPTSLPGPRIVPPPRAVSPSLLPRGPQHFNRTNIQVKASAPNTIQYLPARQQQCMLPSSHRPPTLEFLQRFAAPLTNLDSKVPTHNLQYFPNSGVTNMHPVQNNMGGNPCANTAPPSMICNPGSVNMVMDPMMRRVNSNVSHPSGQIFSGCAGVPSAESPMFGRPPCPSMNNQMISVNPMGRNQTAGMFPNKQMSLSIDGMAPEATQPLPPSMGHAFNYKQSPFYGPTTADPNYAVQFHNFQQQLYATNTRSNQMNSQANMNSQGYFGPK